MRADLDTLLIAVYCAACALFPAVPASRRGRPELISDNELLCLMVGQMLLQSPSERRFLCLAHWRLRHLFPYLPSQPRYNERCRALVPKLVLLWKVIAAETLGADRRAASAGHHSCALWPVDPDDQDERARALGGLRLLPRPLAPLLGLQTRAALRTRRHDRRLRPRRRQHARTRSRPRTPASKRDQRRHRHLRQRDRRRRLRSGRGRARRAPAPTQPQRRTTTAPTRPSAGSDSESSRSSTPSKTNCCSNATAAEHQPDCSPASPHASSPSAPRSTSTNASASTAAH